MTEFQSNSPIDDLYRKTIENMPDAPGQSGWDTPSERVWQHVQANMPKSKGSGWSIGSIVLLSGITLAVLAGLYWWMSKPVQKPVSVPATPPALEQPSSTTPDSNPAENQSITPVKTEKEHNTVKPGTGDAPNAAAAKPAKPSVPSAQPLPGSKNTLPPNSTEAQKKKEEQ